MADVTFPKTYAMVEAIRALIAARPDDAESILAGPATYASKRAEAAMTGDLTYGTVTSTFAARRLADWRLTVCRELMDGAETGGPTLPAADVNDRIRAWTKRIGPGAIQQALSALDAAAAEAEARYDRLTTSAAALDVFNHPNGANVIAELDRKADLIVQRDDAKHRAEDLANAAALIRRKLAALIKSKLDKVGPGLAEAANAATVLQGDVAGTDPELVSLNSQSYRAEGERNRLVQMGIRSGAVFDQVEASFEEAQAGIKARTEALAAQATADAKTVVDDAATGDPRAIARLVNLARMNPRTFGVDAFDDLMSIEAAAICEGGEVAASVVCPND